MSHLAYEKILKAKLEKNPFYTLEKAVYEILLESIVTFQISPGTKLVEYQLAEDFGLSRSPIREALRKLEEQGFVRKHNNTKIVVEPLDPNEYNELIMFRCMFEPEATALASVLMTDDDLKQLKNYADLLLEACKKRDLGLMLHYETLFHESIIEGCQNRYIIAAYKGLRPYLTRSRAAYLYVNKHLEPSICAEEHYLIYNSLVLRNKELTESTVQHLLNMLLMPDNSDETDNTNNKHPYDAIPRQKIDSLSAIVGMLYKQKQ